MNYNWGNFVDADVLETRGGYSLYVGWYGCAAVLTPFFDILRIEHDLFGVLFLIHQQQSYLLGYKNYQFLQKSIFLAPNSIFSSIFLGPIFSGQRHTPISFQAEYPPPPPPRDWKYDDNTDIWMYIGMEVIIVTFIHWSVWWCHTRRPSGVQCGVTATCLISVNWFQYGFACTS